MGSCPSSQVDDVFEPQPVKRHLTATELADLGSELNEAMRLHELQFSDPIEPSPVDEALST